MCVRERERERERDFFIFLLEDSSVKWIVGTNVNVPLGTMKDAAGLNFAKAWTGNNTFLL